MIRKIDKYNKAKALRQAGYSIRFIASKLEISSSTASIWCRNVPLTPEQLTNLQAKSINTDLLKRLAFQKHLMKINRDQEIFNQASSEIKILTNKEFFISGLALYWAEGFKNLSEGRIGFCNSDPRMIVFMIEWFKKFFNVRNEEITLRAEFNIEHLNRQHTIESYWSKLTDIPLSQFNKPFLQKAKWQKNYLNRSNYFGTLRIRIRKSAAHLPRIRGWIEGLSRSFNA